MRERKAVALAVAVSTMGVAVPAAYPASAAAAVRVITSHNWSGYAVHKSDVRFERVSGSWRQPSAVCRRGQSSYSAFWVGIGGYSRSSHALDQIGIELDCNTAGRQTVTAWYELVPEATRPITMNVAGGDVMNAAVRVAGHRVTLALADETRHEAFARTLTANVVDPTSAEWIAEAPSECSGDGNCTTLKLADFGKLAFWQARAKARSGHQGTVDSDMWNASRILLGYSRSSRGLVARSSTAHAVPSSLSGSGSAFTITFSPSRNRTRSTSERNRQTARIAPRS